MKYLYSTVLSALLFGAVIGQNLPPDIQPVKGYLIGPGDVITGKVLGEEQYGFTATVDEDGKIEVPFWDTPIIAKCRTERELRTEITDILTKFLRKPQLSLLTEQKSRAPATIYGEVKTPMQIDLRRKASLVEILAFAGGETEAAGGEVMVIRNQAPQCVPAGDESIWTADATKPNGAPSRTYSLAAVKSGREDANPIIYPGDVVVVQKAAPVYVTGEVISQQGIYIKEDGLSLTEALAKIGGFGREAKKNDIKIYRLKPNAVEAKDREVISANYNLIQKGGQKDVMLQPYDIIEVGRAGKGVLQTVLEIATGAAKTAITSGANTTGVRVFY